LREEGWEREGGWGRERSFVLITVRTSVLTFRCPSLPFPFSFSSSPLPFSPQMSPVIAHNYKESSFPVGLFNWTLENLDSLSPRTVSLLFSFENGIGDGVPRPGGSNRLFVGPAIIVGFAISVAVSVNEI
jgi:hypothetical protein